MERRRRSTVISAVITAAVVLIAAACGGSDAPSDAMPADGLRVASFDFAESVLLAEMYAQVIESGGTPVVRIGSAGPREIVAPAMELDRIDLVPEYLGTALLYAGAAAPNPDTESAFAELATLLAERGLVPLEPSEAEDKNVIVVAADTAERISLENISDLELWAAGQRFGGPAECRDRPLCLEGLTRVYGLSFGEFVPQRSLQITAESLRRGEVDVGLMFSTAPELEADDLVELVDDRSLQPAENLVPVIRRDALERWGSSVETALGALAKQLTTEELRKLNQRVAGGESVATVAFDWLTEKGLLK